jgi:molecular chaperone GrpE
MSDLTPTGAVEGTPVDHPQSVNGPGSPVERVLSDFRTWLAELQSSSLARRISEETEDNGALPEPAVDLFTLVGHFTALRQEVNLQTKAVRAQQEQNTGTLQTLQQSVAALERIRSENRQEAVAGVEEKLRPILKALVELHDALSLAGREISRLQENLGPDLDGLDVVEELPDLVNEPPPLEEKARQPAPSLWGQLFGGRQPAPQEGTKLHEAARAHLREKLETMAVRLVEKTDRVRGALSGVVTGYTMSLQRVERALRQQGLESIPCVGAPFNPELMEALELVAQSGRPSGEVVEEVRRGYLWNGRVFRFAQVRVARD